MCINIIYLYKIRIKWGMYLILKAITIVEHINVWFKIAEYNDNKVMTIVNLVKIMWLTRYLCPKGIMCDRRSEFLGH